MHPYYTSNNTTQAELLNAQYQHSFEISHGNRFLGSFIGTTDLTDNYINDKVSH